MDKDAILDPNLHHPAVTVTRHKLRLTSGALDHDSKLVSFLYELMRDHVPPGVVEGIMNNIAIEGDQTREYTNGWLARYAEDIEKRLTSGGR